MSRRPPFFPLVLTFLVLGGGCKKPSGEEDNRIVIWHQMRPDEGQILQRQVKRYTDLNPGREVVVIYKETEVLRSAFVNAAITRRGPDLVHGPSDAVGIYVATKAIQPLETIFPAEYLARFDSSGLLRII